jgi:hypothetical protein
VHQPCTGAKARGAGAKARGAGAKARGAGDFVISKPAHEPAPLAGALAMHQCKSQGCWELGPSYTSTLLRGTGYFVASTPGVNIQCSPAQEPVSLVKCSDVSASPAGHFFS